MEPSDEREVINPDVQAPVGVVGWGRFGRAVGGLIARAGARVLAYEPDRVVEPEIRVASPEVLAERARWVLLAVPIPQLRPALRRLRPFLRPDHRVLDVGSVKVRPEEVLRQELGPDIPWVATHPLFGPVSLARGERPLRVVVCPNPAHPWAVRAVVQWYTYLGCAVTLQSAEAHDRKMAFSHALAFFLAKGLLDMGADVRAELNPPSFRALESTINAVRADAGHLFQTIQLQNPFAQEARETLLEALRGIHSELANMDAERSGDAGPRVSIPDLGEEDPLKKPRVAQLEEVDRELVTLIARRVELRSRFEADGNLGRRRRSRQGLVNAWARSAGVDPTLLGRIFALLDA